jgi:hypothetical protein
MKNIYSLLLLLAGLPLLSSGQDAGVFKANHIKSSVSWLFNDKTHLMDSCVYNEEGQLIFCRVYNLFKENDYEDKRYTYNGAGLQIKCVNYDVDGKSWLTDSIGFDTQNRRISEKVYRNNNGQVFMDKKMRYQQNRVDIEDTNSKNVFLRTYDKQERLSTETLYRDTVVVEKTTYTYDAKRIVKKEFRGEVLYKVTTEDGAFREETTYQHGVVVGQVQVKKLKNEEEKVIFENGLPVKKEMTTFNDNGLKEVIKYYEHEKYYQHLQYEYRR